MDVDRGGIPSHDTSGLSSGVPISPYHPKSYVQATFPVVGRSGDYLQRSFVPDEMPVNDTVRTNALADRNTIVDMSLRLPRFVLCVVLALVFAFGFALLTSNKKTLTYVFENQLAAHETLSTEASSVVENYNTLFGYILFSGGKIFEVFCETLIFPTLATYLHNCSLYPGDQPARMHSVVKTRCIFWGLKTVIILMNVGFTSVYVGQTTLEAEPSSRHLAVSDMLTASTVPLETVEWNANAFPSILRSIVVGETTPFALEESCGRSPDDTNHSNKVYRWNTWANEVDTTSVSFSFPSYTWNAPLLLSQGAIVPTMSVKMRLRDYLVNNTKDASADDWDLDVLYATFRKGIDRLGLSKAFHVNATAPHSFSEFIQQVARELDDALPSRFRVNELALHLELRELANDIQFTSMTLTIPVKANDRGSTMCGATGCVYATSTSGLKQLGLQPIVSMASYDEDENSALMYGSTSQFYQGTSASKPHEVVTLSLGKLTWRLKTLHNYHNAACGDDEDQLCIGLSLPLRSNNRVSLLVGKDALATQHVGHPLALATVHPIVIIDTTHAQNNALTSWHRLVLPHGVPVTSSVSDCNPLVDAYLTHLETNHFYLDEHLPREMYSAALLYLFQRGVPTSFTYARRLDTSTGTPATTDIEVNVPTATALVTVAGCIFIVLLMLCVIYLPTARVKLSPDTTPAAQYVQILTDDLYPDVVYKKRLRFANGDCLLFNEYVVDAIVLHAKRDHTKKIYL